MYRLVQGEKTRLRPAAWGFSDVELRRRYQWSLDDELQYWSGAIPGGRYFAQFSATVGQRDWPSDGRRISYAILTNHEELIGMVSCYNIDRRKQTGEIGIYIGEKDRWSEGYGTDALITFLRHLFDDLGFQSVYLHTYESNLRAQHSYDRVGFSPEEARRRYSTRLGYHNEVRMTITRDVFASRHGLRQTAAVR
ncbi:MAG: GNAT family N-acetyltransferase [Chloroflexota bacterium]|nr:MAG: hypothetical protein DLM70_19670 [Chloroflexota bacterium]